MLSQLGALLTSAVLGLSDALRLHCCLLTRRTYADRSVPRRAGTWQSETILQPNEANAKAKTTHRSACRLKKSLVPVEKSINSRLAGHEPAKAAPAGCWAGACKATRLGFCPCGPGSGPNWWKNTTIKRSAVYQSMDLQSISDGFSPAGPTTGCVAKRVGYRDNA